jgi:uncharacterized membrane protein YbhN (UPF0104 family)
MSEHAWPITFGFLMIALLFVLMLFVPPSEQLARYWVTVLIVGLILTTIFCVEDFDVSGWLRSRREYKYDPYYRLVPYGHHYYWKKKHKRNWE